MSEFVHQKTGSVGGRFAERVITVLSYRRSVEGLQRIERRERPDLEGVLVDLFYKVLGISLLCHVECVILQVVLLLVRTEYLQCV